MSMILRDVDYGPIACASGAQGWFGEGYPYHKYIPKLDFTGCTFVAKTTTLDARKGNLPLNRSWGPKGLFPACVKVKPFKGVVLNSVGLSGPGARALLTKMEWQRRKKPFFLSFMEVSPKVSDRIKDLGYFVGILKRSLGLFNAPVALQWNVSCPNVGLKQDELISEILMGLDLLADLDIPIVLKVNALFPFDAALEVEQHPAFDGICVSNTIPWGKAASKIDWKGLFGSDVSPLEKHGFGSGGLSGTPLLPLVFEWVAGVRAVGFTKPINAGGGVMRPKDVNSLRDAGADSVFIGSVAILRGWRVPSIIERAHALQKNGW